MPTTKAAAKALRQSIVNHRKNVSARLTIKKLIKQSRKLALAGKADEAQTDAHKAIKAIDKAAQKKILPKNAAARTKSRLLAFLKKQKT